MEVYNNKELSQFEVQFGAETAYSEYEVRDGNMYFKHTDVPEDMKGKGVGRAIARTALTFARENQLKVVPWCPFFKGYIERHPEYQDLL